ncbi:MAG: hypothetical protein MZU97_00110 [Bacillus subtilis]|nr:hypothetical protein [Bacillus subtilis]
MLGNHVSQQGSQVTSQSLRFDFNHYQAISEAEILKLEEMVNAMIQTPHQNANARVVGRRSGRPAAPSPSLAKKYGEKVRVVDLLHTLDLCGGTHVDDIQNIRKFAILSVASIGSGIYRIEGLTSDNVASIVDHLVGINPEHRQSSEKSARDSNRGE